LAQLHQLRGRVGRGSEKSYCILLTGSQVGKDAKERMSVMCSTHDGFKIAEKDLELRGPGDIQGTRQSGALNFRLADIVDDRELLEQAKRSAEKLLVEDPELKKQENAALGQFLQVEKGSTHWGRIS